MSEFIEELKQMLGDLYCYECGEITSKNPDNYCKHGVCDGKCCSCIKCQDELLEEEEEEHPAHKFFEERDCAYCRAFFDQGKDNCKVCGFDLNSWSKKEEEEDSEDEEEETKPCFKCGKICGLKSMYCRNDAFYCDVNCYIDLQMKMYDTKIQTLKKPSAADILKSIKKN